MAGLLDRFFGSPEQTQALGLLGAALAQGQGAGSFAAPMQYLAGADERRMKQGLLQMQLEQAQMEMEQARRNRAVQQQFEQAARESFITPERATAMSMGPNPDGSNMPFVQPGFDSKGFVQKAYGIDPFRAMEVEQKFKKAPIKLGAGESLLSPDTYAPIYTAPEKDSVPASVKEYQFAVGQGFKGSFADFEMAKRRAGASSTNVSVNTDKSYFGNVAEGLAKVDVGAIDAGRSAPERVASARRVKEVLATNPITGTGAEARLGLNRALATAGLIDGTTVANTEVLASTLASQTLDAIKTSGLGSGQGFTDKDRAFLERAKSGNIEMTPQALATLADLNERAAIASIRRANSVIGKLRQSPQSGAMGQALDMIPEPSVPPVVRRQPGQAPQAGGVRFLGFE
jgi:hypothetical protein